MHDDERYRLRFGPYTTPTFNYGETVRCEVWGDVQIVGLSDGRIPWPLGRPQGKRGRAMPVVYEGLAVAVRREAEIALRDMECFLPFRLN